MGKLRIMKIKDYPRLYELWVNTPGMGLNSIDDTKEGFTRFLRRNPHTCFCYEEDGMILGAIMAGNDGRRGYIYHTAVHPSCQRKGIGTMLLDEALKALGKEGISKAALVVFERNKVGNTFWQEMGFSQRKDIIYRNRSLKEVERIDT